MSIVVNDMDMPTSCSKCPFVSDYNSKTPPTCTFLHKQVIHHSQRMEDCPLQELPCDPNKCRHIIGYDDAPIEDISQSQYEQMLDKFIRYKNPRTFDWNDTLKR